MPYRHHGYYYQTNCVYHWNLVVGTSAPAVVAFSARIRADRGHRTGLLVIRAKIAWVFFSVWGETHCHQHISS